MSISAKVLVRAYLTLLNSFKQLHQVTRWENIEILQGRDAQTLRIVKQIELRSDEHFHSEDPENEVLEDDEEIVKRSSDGGRDLLVIYDIIHSPSYQVPVLYITFKLSSNGRLFSGPINLDAVYELLAPTSRQQPMRSTGVMGALSMTDHPVTGTAAYFVHPCRTAEAMRAVTGDEDVSPQKYLLIWIGLVGQSVGLEVPIELAQSMTKAM